MRESNSLPRLQSLIFPALLTIFRSKEITSTIYKQSYVIDKIDRVELHQFASIFGFNNQIPLTYWYLLAQRAQVSCMVNKQFSIPIPGLIHLENTITQIAEIDVDTTIDLLCEVIVDNKNDANVLCEFKVDFIQHEKKVISVKSLYLKKKKSKTRKKRKQNIQFLNSGRELDLEINHKKALNYAKLSGDYNPIHISSFLAKLFGFKKAIIHGWYIACVVCENIEKIENKHLNKVIVKFVNPIYIPSKVKLSHQFNQAQVTEGEKVLVTFEFDF